MDDWKQAEQIFLTAVDLAPAERPDFLGRACSGNAELRCEVESLLEADTKNGAGIVEAIETEAQSLFGMESAPESRIGNYRIAAEIGRGGMSTVYRAVRDDEQFEQQVAIKLIRRGMDTEDVLGRFRDERQILANLDHPYIGRLLDGGSAPDGRPFLVMEYVEGVPLDVYCEAQSLDLRARCRLFLKVCEAVSCAHGSLVVHRDLKPGNILVGADGSPKLLDFGVAKLLEPGAGSEHTVTAAGMRMMTPDYASPEQFRGDPITTAADVYSLGAVLYQILSGARPHQFAGRGLREVERVICEVEPRRPSEAASRWRNQLRGDLDAIVAKAMRKEPSRRYESVEQFAADLRRYLEGFPVVARQGDLAYRAGKFLARNRTWVAAGILFAAVLIGGAGASAIQARRAEMERRDALASRASAEASRKEAQRQAAESERQRGMADDQRRQAVAERAEAETERQLAERRFEEVRQLSGKFLFDFHDAIANLTGSTPARKMVVDTGLKYFDSLVREANGNREVLEEVARGYDRLGDVQGSPYDSNLGDFSGALKSYRKARALRAGISDPSPQFLRDRVAGNNRLAGWLVIRGSTAEADEILRETFRLGQTPQASADYEIRAGLARAYVLAGDLKVRDGHYNDAIAPFTKVVEIWTELAKVGRDPAAEQAGLSLGHNKLSDVYARTAHPAEALVHIRTSLDIDQRLSEADANNKLRLRRLQRDYEVLGLILLVDSGKPLDRGGEARAAMQTSADLAERISAADPTDQRALADVRVTQEFLGDALRDDHDAEAALPHYLRALDIAKQTGAGPLNRYNIESLLMAHQRLARGLIEAGRPAEALDHLRQGDQFVADGRKLGPDATTWTGWQENLDRARALAYSRQGNWAEAIAGYRAVVADNRELLQRDPKDDGAWSNLRAALSDMADCYATIEQWGQAALAMQEALNSLEEVAPRRPLRPDEEKARQAGLAKIAEWKAK